MQQVDMSLITGWGPIYLCHPDLGLIKQSATFNFKDKENVFHQNPQKILKNPSPISEPIKSIKV